jgi:hypothetical protein
LRHPPAGRGNLLWPPLLIWPFPAVAALFLVFLIWGNLLPQKARLKFLRVWVQRLQPERLPGKQTAIVSFKLGKRQPYGRALHDLRAALEAAGVEFTNGDQPGVRLKSHVIRATWDPPPVR